MACGHVMTAYVQRDSMTKAGLAPYSTLQVIPLPGVCRGNVPRVPQGSCAPGGSGHRSCQGHIGLRSHTQLDSGAADRHAACVRRTAAAYLVPLHLHDLWGTRCLGRWHRGHLTVILHVCTAACSGTVAPAHSHTFSGVRTALTAKLGQKD